jgi:peptide/nickel transport system substrate-binding protein
LWLAALALCLACNGERPVADKPGAPRVDDDRPRDGGTLYRRLDTDIVTVNPVISGNRYDTYVAQYLFTPLIYLDESLRPIPGLAKSWEVSDDGRLYRFELNEKATFSDGTPVRASDVVFTLRKIVDPTSEAVRVIGSFEQLDLARTRAIDDHTVEIAFREALATQLTRFYEVMVIPEHVYSKGDFRTDFNSRAVGSGPYTLVRRVEGKEVVVERRRDYWGPRPHIQTVVFKVISDHAVGWNALKRGEIDESLITSDTWLREQNNPTLTKYIDFRRFYTLNYNYIAWNNRDPLLRDRDIRRALSMCVPTEAIVKDIYHGMARAMSGQFTPDEWAYNPTVPVVRFDPDEAKRIFTAKGWQDRDGDGVLEKGNRKFQLEFVIMHGNPTTRQFAQMVQSELAKVGVKMDITLLEGAMALQRLQRGNFQAFYAGWDLDPDPDPYALFHSSQMPPRGQNFVHYVNPEADRLMDVARRELDQSKRKDLYWRLHEVLSADQPYTWVTQVSAKWGINKRVRGVETSRGFGLFLWYPGELGWWLAAEPTRP